MNFDINAVLADMLSAMKEVLPKNRPEVENIVKQFAKERKNTLEMLAELYRKGEITPQKLESRLEEEKIILEVELEALKVVSKALAQKAINAAFDALTNAIKTTVKTII